MNSHYLHPRSSVEKIDWRDQTFGMVHMPGRFPDTSGGYGAGFEVNSVPSLPLLYVLMMGDQSMIRHR